MHVRATQFCMTSIDLSFFLYLFPSFPTFLEKVSGGSECEDRKNEGDLTFADAPEPLRPERRHAIVAQEHGVTPLTALDVSLQARNSASAEGQVQGVGEVGG